jgi:NADH-quinone oxidoreductase subunit L
MLVFGALLTAFYMTRQVAYVFFGARRGNEPAHESPRVMTAPLAILAFFAMALGLIGTPAWPWFRAFLEGSAAELRLAWLRRARVHHADGASTVVVFVGLGLGLWLYGDRSPAPEQPDALEMLAPLPWGWLRDRLYVDELYGATVIAFYGWWARVADWLDRRVWGGRWPGLRGPSADGRGSTASSIRIGWTAASTKAAKNWPVAEACCRACRTGACRPT